MSGISPLTGAHEMPFSENEYIIVVGCLLTSVGLVIRCAWSLVWRERWGRRGGRGGVGEGPEDDMVFLHVPTEAVECDVIAHFNNVLCMYSYKCTNTCKLPIDAFATGAKNLDQHQLI